MKEIKYILTEEELLSLLVSKITLIALENGGVDNWEWFGDSIYEYKQMFIENNKDIIQSYCKENNIDVNDFKLEIDDISRLQLCLYKNSKFDF